MVHKKVIRAIRRSSLHHSRGCLVASEACGGAPYWARGTGSLGPRTPSFTVAPERPLILIAALQCGQRPNRGANHARRLPILSRDYARTEPDAVVSNAKRGFRLSEYPDRPTSPRLAGHDPGSRLHFQQLDALHTPHIG